MGRSFITVEGESIEGEAMEDVEVLESQPMRSTI
jgi:hypothetical protein